ncbi:MAG: futalosine hydrolase [Deinococcales bacterium]
MSGPLLLVSATAEEARPLREALDGASLPARWGHAWEGRLGDVDVVLTHLGVGKANTAAGLALALERWRPEAVVQYGIGGAFVGSFLSSGMVAVASTDVHVDTGAGEADAWEDMESVGFPLLEGPPPRFNEMPTDRRLSERLAAPSAAPLLRFATSERVTGSLEEADRLQRRFDVAIESMEGAAAAQVCLALGVPFAEIRAVSNVVGERDRRTWDVPRAIRAVQGALGAALPDLAASR